MTTTSQSVLMFAEPASTSSQATQYSLASALLHWVMAAFIVAGFGLGVTLSAMPLSPTKFRYIAWHKWIGITVLGLLALRLLSRLLTRAPALPKTMSSLMRRLASATHLTLYGLMFAVPLTGWAMSSAYGISVVYLKFFRLPELLVPNPALAGQLRLVHARLAWTMAAAVLGHIAAALKHHFLDRDGLLSRLAVFGR